MNEDLAQKLKHEVRNATQCIRGVIFTNCRGCRTPEDQSVPHMIRDWCDQIETAVDDYVSSKRPRSIKSGPNSY